MRNKLKYIKVLLPGLFLLASQHVWAAGPQEPSIFSNSLAIIFFVLIIILLIVISVLANILLGAADINLRKKKKETGHQSTIITILLFAFMLSGSSLFAQDAANAGTSGAVAKTIGGMAATSFYTMVAVIFLELFIILTLLINIRFLLKTEKEKLVVETKVAEVKKPQLNWWARFNKLKPVSEEADLDLGHDYDGIRELNNRLPPWWLYGFYITILFAAIYLWRFHVSHNGPSSKEEYEASVASAEIKIQEYLKKKGESVDENTVTFLTSADDLQAGKAIFTDPTKCPTCHRADGGGNTVGPNLTDDYWIYGGGIKDLFKTIKYGTNKGMKSWKDDLSAKQIAQVASYVKSLKGSNPPNPKAPDGQIYKDESPGKPKPDSTKKDDKVVMNM